MTWRATHLGKPFPLSLCDNHRGFVYWGNLHRRKSAASPKFDMVWIHRSPIQVGRRGVISSFKTWFLPAFATRRGRGRGSAPRDKFSSQLSVFMLSHFSRFFAGFVKTAQFRVISFNFILFCRAKVTHLWNTEFREMGNLFCEITKFTSLSFPVSQSEINSVGTPIGSLSFCMKRGN